MNPGSTEMEALAGCVAVITGASTGIGQGITVKLAAVDAGVVLNEREGAGGLTYS